MEGNHWHSVFVKIQETRISVHHRLHLRRPAGCKDALETPVYFLRHGNLAHSPCSFGFLDNVLHIALPLQLVADVYFPILHIYIGNRQPYKFRYPHPCMKQNIYPIIIFAEMPVIPDEFQKIPFLFPCNGLPRHAVVDHHRSHLEVKRVLSYQVIVCRHLECRADHPAHCFNAAVPSSVLLQFDKPCLGIRKLYFVYPPFPEFLLFQNADDKLIVRLRIMPDAGLQGYIFPRQIQHCHVAALRHNLVKQVGFYLLLLFPERQIPLSPCRGAVILIQPPAVYIPDFPIPVNILKHIPSVRTLAFAVAQNPVAAVASFFTH